MHAGGQEAAVIMSVRGSDDDDTYTIGMGEDERESQCDSNSVVTDTGLGRSTSVDAENDDSYTPDAMQGVEYTGNSTLKGAATGLGPADSNDDQAFSGQISGLEERMAKLSLSEEEEKREEETNENNFR